MVSAIALSVFVCFCILWDSTTVFVDEEYHSGKDKATLWYEKYNGKSLVNSLRQKYLNLLFVLVLFLPVVLKNSCE